MKGNMAKLIAGFLFLGFIILAAVHIGEAACACVLWSNVGTAEPNQELSNYAVLVPFSGWVPTRAFDTLQACDWAMSEADVREINVLGPKRNKNKPKDALRDVFIFRCLPDTIDLRGPKAGER